MPNGYVLDLSVKDAGGNDVTVTESEGSYTFTMPASDATVSGITDVWDIAGGADGSEEHPYIITTTAGLDLLAKMVNGTDGYTTNTFQNKFFTLDADITYPHTTDWNDATSTENNFTAIGYSQMNSFRGTFNGAGHTVSGIRIYKDTDAEDSDCQGLFGFVYGTVRNVTLSDARITGRNDVGGIVGMFFNYDDTHPGTIKNCHTDNVAIHAVVSDADCHGGIVGYLSSGTVSGCTSSSTNLTIADNLTSCDCYGIIVGYKNEGTLTANYYRNCTVGDKISDIGCNGSDRDGARGVYALTLADGVTITAASEPVVIGTSTYYASNSTVTCTYSGSVSEGYAITFNATDGTVSGNTITVPHQDITVSAVTTPVTYTIDYDLAGGSVATANPVSYTVETPTFTLTNPTREGCQFMGSTGNRSYTANWTTDFWGIAATGADGSEEHPYIITTTAGLDLLATRVNSGTGDDYASSGYSGKFFKLGADIAYDYDSDPSSTENNFTTIGTSQMKSFRGNFDGDGYTVSGIRIYKPNDNYQGLFGYVEGGTVMNVTLSFARITGKSNVGGIVGYLKNYNDDQIGTIKDCHTYDVTIHSVVSDADCHGGIVGNLSKGTVSDCDCWYSGLTVADNLTSCDFYGGIVGYNNAGTVSGCTAYQDGVPNVVSSYGLIAGYSNGTLTANYYTECRLNGSYTPTGMGCNGSDRDGARSVHYLMLDGYATATGESVVIDGTTYYVAGTTITLGVNCPLPDGLVCHGFALNGTALSGNTFAMPDWSGASHVARASAYILPDADIYLGGGAGTEDNPFVITTAEGLNMLSKAVCQMTQSCYGLYFQLGADIAYDPDVLTIDNDGDGVDESNFTPISYLNVHFQGRFDGQGHTISGIRCSDNNYSSLALFGALGHPDSYVKNVVVADASFTGNSQVGGIVANLYNGLVENCRVVGATLTSSSDPPAAIANYCTSGHLSNNYYFGCTATKQGSTPVTSGIGVHFCVMGDQAPIYNDDIESRTYDGVTYTDCAVEGVALYDDDSALPSGSRNADVIAGNIGTGKNVMLYDRTLYRDGTWNTLCLPFDIDDIDGTPLEDATVRELDEAYITGTVLTLNFKAATTRLEAGTPYIVKWTPEEDDEVDNVISPMFQNVTIDADADGSYTSSSGDELVRFLGTYTSTIFTETDQSILFMGEDNKLYYPLADARIGACRAYFKIGDGTAPARQLTAFRIGFEGENPTLVTLPSERETDGMDNPSTYDLSGRKIVHRHIPKGVYVRDGRKVVIK